MRQRLTRCAIIMRSQNEDKRQAAILLQQDIMNYANHCFGIHHNCLGKGNIYTAKWDIHMKTLRKSMLIGKEKSMVTVKTKRKKAKLDRQSESLKGRKDYSRYDGGRNADAIVRDITPKNLYRL